MPTDQTVQQAPPGKAEAFMNHMKSFADRIVDNARKNPELYSSVAGAGTGALLGTHIAENPMEGALKGAALGGASGYALNQILKNPPPAIPTVDAFKEQPKQSILTAPINHPIATGAAVGTGALVGLPYAKYKLSKHLGDKIETDINGVKTVSKEGIYSVLSKFFKGDAGVFEKIMNGPGKFLPKALK